MRLTYKIILLTFINVMLAQCGSQIQNTLTLPQSNQIQPPKDLAAVSCSTSQIVLIWADYSNNETAFIIERSENNATFSFLKMMPVNSVTFLDKNLEPNKKYYYRVKAIGETAQSHYSNIAEAQTEKG